MPPFNALELFNKTPEMQFSVPSFDVSGGNIDILHAIYDELEKKGCTAFISSTPQSIESYFGINSYFNVINQVSKRYKVNFAIHLDHATDPEYVFRAIDMGFTSVMFDGSSLPINENIVITKEIVSEAKRNNVSVEAELGIIGGKEDEINSEDSLIPSISDCIHFVQKTDIDLFAPAIGTSHGIYKMKPKISWSLVNQLHTKLSLPLVLHGGSGLDKDILIKLIKNNFKKVNYATGIRQAFLNGILQRTKSEDSIIKPQEYLRTGRLRVSEFVNEILSVHIEEKTNH